MLMQNIPWVNVMVVKKKSRRAHVSAQELRMIPITWSFAVWVLDMVGPFKRSKDKKTHLLVAVDKFTKWVEAIPIALRLRLESRF